MLTVLALTVTAEVVIFLAGQSRAYLARPSRRARINLDIA